MQEWYEEADIEKKEVEEFRQKFKDDLLEGGDDDDPNRLFQEWAIYPFCFTYWCCFRNIDKLPRTLEQAAQEIHKLTGWACTIIVGGPMPKLGGAIQTLV